MAIAIRGGAPVVSATASNPVTATLTGTQQPQTDDVLLIIHGNDFYDLTNMATPTVGGSSSGVTAVTNAAGDAGTNGAHAKAYTKVITSTGDVTVSVTETGSADEEKVLVVYVLSGVDTSTPADVASNGASAVSASTFVLPSVTTTPTDDMLFAFAVTQQVLTVGGAWSAGTSDFDSNFGGFISYVGMHQQLAASGATGTRTFDPVGSEAAAWAGVLVTLKTGSGGGGAVTGPVASPRMFSPFAFRRPTIPPFQMLGVREPTRIAAQGAVCSAAAIATGRATTGAPPDPNQAVPQVAWMFLQPSDASFQLSGDTATPVAPTGAAQTGQALAAATSQARAVKVAQQGAVCSAAATASAGARKVAPQAGQVSAAATAQVGDKRVAPVTAQSYAAATAQSGPRKLAPAAGRTFGAGFAYWTASVPPRAQGGFCGAAGFASGRATHIAVRSGQSLAAGTAQGRMTKRAMQGGTSSATAIGQGACRKIVRGTAHCPVAVAAYAALSKRVAQAGRTYAVTYTQAERRALSCQTSRPNTGTTARPSSGITARPDTGTTERPCVMT